MIHEGILLYNIHYKTFLHFEIANYYCLVPFDMANKGTFMVALTAFQLYFHVASEILDRPK